MKQAHENTLMLIFIIIIIIINYHHYYYWFIVDFFLGHPVERQKDRKTERHHDWKLDVQLIGILY